MSKKLFGRSYRKLRKETKRDIKGKIGFITSELIVLAMVGLSPSCHLLIGILNNIPSKNLLIPALVSIPAISIVSVYWTIHIMTYKRLIKGERVRYKTTRNNNKSQIKSFMQSVKYKK